MHTVGLNTNELVHVGPHFKCIGWPLVKRVGTIPETIR